MRKTAGLVRAIEKLKKQKPKVNILISPSSSELFSSSETQHVLILPSKLSCPGSD
jgi:hypothetical protein